MTPQNIIVKILMCKQEKIKHLTNIDYITDEDIEEVKTWSNEICTQILDCMYNELCKLHYKEDHVICPWCIKIDYRTKDRYCATCKYGKRHGVCWLGYSNTYQSILNQLPGHDIEYIKDIPRLIDDIINILNQKGENNE